MRHAFSLIGLVVASAAASIAILSAAPQEQAPNSPVARAAALIERAREAAPQPGVDRRARDDARRAYDEAERLLRAEIRRDATCVRCLQLQAGVHLFRSTSGLANEYEDSIEVSRRGLALAPASLPLLYIKGFAHYNRRETAEALASFKRFLILGPNDPDAPEVRQLVTQGEQQFLASWYTQAGFYESNQSRITRYNPQTFRNEITFQTTPAYELQLGQQGFLQLSQAAPRTNDPQAVAFLEQLVNRVVDRTPGPGFRYALTLVESNDVNAMTLPGHIIVHTGLLRFVETEAQLAGILSHEIAHNYGHHAVRRLLTAYHLQSAAAAVATAVNPQTATAQLVTTLTSSIGVGLFLNAHSRSEEREADLYGTHLMFNAGYNPTALPELFLKLYEANPTQSVKFLSTHPPVPDRINYLSDYLQAFPLNRELVVDSSEAFRRLKERYP